MARPPFSDGLIDPRSGDLISAAQARIQNEILRSRIGLPNAITDSLGTRMVLRRSQNSTSHKYVEITYINDSDRNFAMSDHGVCIGKLINYIPEANWLTTYPGDVIEDAGQEVFCGFVDQARGGVPGQRYYARSNGTKTCVCGEKEEELTLPLVMLEGGSPTAAVLAEDHPGCGSTFAVWIAPVWNPGANQWNLTSCDSGDENDQFTAIDLREGMPLPEKYATGIFAPRVSTSHGIILEALEIDCTSPGACGFCDQT